MKVLVTGGAGFIGSHLVSTCLERGDDVRVLDNLITGYVDNVDERAELLVGSVADEEAVRKAVTDVDVVFHLGAHRAVSHSVEHPLATDEANTHGTLTVLKEAHDAGVRRVVYASSSSIYGGADIVPTPESAPARPRSPYAVSKLAAEHYCRVFAELYGLETVALRYFNVFGPRQRPDSAYAAVIPLFTEAALTGTPAIVHGDGLQSRDFTFVSDVVAANLAAASADASRCSGKAYNIAPGTPRSLLDLLKTLGTIVGRPVEVEHMEARAGDVRNSCADSSAARADLGHECRVGFEDGLARTVAWVQERLARR